ncbi:hypothetical protein GCM10017559_30810 [Streptosporangium longisporum]|uniref:D-isomer specific 2-hydroxyacid dehydrogenase NAD-binding domain-containing protein n=1 Tax=Streptosporangium longisporum TaxID=46187 RepID=A0ABN3XYC8_9ACTN
MIPSAAFAMQPGLLPELFPADLRLRLSRVARVREGVLSSFDPPPDVEILITGWGCPPIGEDVLERAPRLRAIVHAAGSVKGHVTPAVFERGVAVSSAAEANALPVAEFTLAMLVLAAKQVFVKARAYSADGWSGDALPGVATPGEGGGLNGAVVGVIGASRVGRLVMERLRGHGARILLSDPYVGPAEAAALGAEAVTLDELCGRADLVTVHAPALPETRGLLDERRLALLRDGAVLVNTARGSIVDTGALVRHCAGGPHRRGPRRDRTRAAASRARAARPAERPGHPAPERGQGQGAAPPGRVRGGRGRAAGGRCPAARRRPSGGPGPDRLSTAPASPVPPVRAAGGRRLTGWGRRGRSARG